MSLFQLAEHIQITNNLKYPHKGRVVKTDKDESKKLGRLKCVVKGMFEDETEDKKRLPWIYPQNPFGLGGRPDSSEFSVPELDSEVTIVFPFEDIYHPYYTGYWQSELTHQHALFDEDYPHSYGWIDSVIEWFKVNKRVGDADDKSYLEFFRKYLGDLFRLDEDGNIWINIPKSLYVKIGEDSRVEIVRDQIKKVGESVFQEIGIDQMVKIGNDNFAEIGTDQMVKIGNDNFVEIGTDQMVKIGNDNFADVGFDQTIRIGADNYTKIDANYTQKVEGNHTLRINGSQESDIGGNQTITCVSNMSHQAVRIDHNSGIKYAVADASEVVEENIDPNYLAEHQTELQILQIKMDEMQAKIDELTTLAVEIKARADENKPNIANPKNME